jgi:hypothetical protein
MKIADMESHHDEYAALDAKIRTMLENREFPAVFPVCEASFPHIVPAIKYRKKRGIEPETPALLSFGVITKYAPPLFEHSVLESLSGFVKSTRLLAKQEQGHLEAIEIAFEQEEMARVLWNHLEARPGFLQRDIRKELGIGQERALAIIEIWEELGVVGRRKESLSYALDFGSRLDAITGGVCQCCGVRGKGPREAFFKPVLCRNCGVKGYYHIVYSGDR